MRASIVLFFLAGLTACEGDTADFAGSTATEPTVDFGLVPPDVDTDRPVNSCVDSDGDGYGDGCEIGKDCDDTDPEINPSEVEVGYDGVDNDCDPNTADDDLDKDGAVLADDCDDNNAAIGPNSPEICFNGVDDDCNADTEDEQDRGVSSCPFELTAASCDALLTANPSQAGIDGFYSLTLGTGYCDMTTDGGGWTLAMVVADDGVDTYDWTDAGLLGTRAKQIGSIHELDRDYRSQFFFKNSVPMSDVMFRHEPSGVWAAYTIGDSSQAMSFESAEEGPVSSPICYDSTVSPYPPADAGYEMIAGTLASDLTDALDGRELCDTKLYFHLGDHESGDQDTCKGIAGDEALDNATYGPTWNSAELIEGDCATTPFNDPALSALGPDKASPEVESAALGFAGPLGLNTGTAGSGENRMELFVR